MVKEETSQRETVRAANPESGGQQEPEQASIGEAIGGNPHHMSGRTTEFEGVGLGDSTFLESHERQLRLWRMTLRARYFALGPVGSVKDTVEARLPLLADRTDTKHLDASRSHYLKARKSLDELAVNDRNRTPIHPQYVARLISELSSEDAVFIPDVGSPVVWAARYLRMNGSRRLIGSFNHGSMANALSQSIGAQAAFPGRQVVALAGDGGLAMLMGELLTLVQRKLPVKIVVFNNSSLNFVEVEMKAAGFVNFGTGLENPDFARVAEAIGIHGQRVEKPDDLEGALRTAFAHDGPALVDVVTARQELSIPPAITAEQVKGFTLYALRTIMSGRGDELIDLADTNVFRRLFD